MRDGKSVRGCKPRRLLSFIRHFFSIISTKYVPPALIFTHLLGRVTRGGCEWCLIGSAFDELELNRVLCEHYGVKIAGVVVNKVRADSELHIYPSPI